MTDLSKLVDDFKADFEAGRDPDAAELVKRVPPEQRQELVALLDSYVMQAPRRPWDPEAYEGSLAKIAVDRVYESIEPVPGSWPTELPRLRERARIKRRELVERLAQSLGFAEQPQIEKIGVYYHRMETGELPASGVSLRVIEALAGILDWEPSLIVDSGGLGRFSRRAGDASFARTAFPNPDYVAESLDALAQTPAGEAAERQAGERDEIDALFLDG